MKRLLIITVAFVICSPLSSRPQSNTPALPPDAQANFDKGLAAAGQKEWELAVKYFEEARHNCSNCGDKFPQIFFNLGLAYAKAGDELPAIAWLHTYLAAVPNAKNAADVHREITSLEVATEVKVHKLLQNAAERIDKLPNDWKRCAAASVENFLANIGEYAGAEAIKDRYGYTTEYLVKECGRQQTGYAIYPGLQGDFASVEARLDDKQINSWGRDGAWQQISSFWNGIDSKLALHALEKVKDAKMREDPTYGVRAEAANAFEAWKSEADSCFQFWGLPTGSFGAPEARLKYIAAHATDKWPSYFIDEVAFLAYDLNRELLRLQALSKKFSSN